MVQISSGSARVAFPRTGTYAATQWALEGLSATMRYELMPLGVELCLVEPGAFPTRFRRNGLALWEAVRAEEEPREPERFAAYADHLGRYAAADARPATADPQDMADAVLALARMPAGTRPMRTVVAMPPEVAVLTAFNDGAEAIERGFLAQVGFEDWLSLASRR